MRTAQSLSHYISANLVYLFPSHFLRCLTLLIVALAEGMIHLLVSELPQYSLYSLVQWLELYFLSLQNGLHGCVFPSLYSSSFSQVLHNHGILYSCCIHIQLRQILWFRSHCTVGVALGLEIFVWRNFFFSSKIATAFIHLLASGVQELSSPCLSADWALYVGPSCDLSYNLWLRHIFYHSLTHWRFVFSVFSRYLSSSLSPFNGGLLSLRS